MKKYVLMAMLFVTGLVSCQKKYCWKCVMYHTNSAGVLDLTNPEKSTQCDMTEAQIKAYEKSHTKTKTVFNGHNNQETTIETANCSQQ